MKTVYKLSIVVPILNEEAGLPAVLERFGKVIDTLPAPLELIFVNDGSIDRTADILIAARQRDPRIKIITLSRNFGHQFAITAGLDVAQGDACVVIDGDLQDPPELIPQLLDKWKEGFHVVHAVRQERQGETIFKKLTAAIFYRLMKKLSKVPISLDAGDFRLMDHRVVEAMRQIRERGRFVRGLVSWAGYRQTSVGYVREARNAGETKYPLFKMIRFAVDAITSFSIIPLQIATSVGLLFSVGAFFCALWILYVHYFTGRTVSGWTSQTVLILFFGGVQLIFLGVVGEYVGRILEEVKERPLYLVSSREGFDDIV